MSVFFTFVKKPTVNNIQKYNHAVSVLWIAMAAVRELNLGIVSRSYWSNLKKIPFIQGMRLWRLPRFLKMWILENQNIS